jgi:antitoxin YefM
MVVRRSPTRPGGSVFQGNNAVLVSAEDWEAIQETLFLLSIPGMRESIREGMDTPIDECSKDLDW